MSMERPDHLDAELGARVRRAFREAFDDRPPRADLADRALLALDPSTGPGRRTGGAPIGWWRGFLGSGLPRLVAAGTGVAFAAVALGLGIAVWSSPRPSSAPASAAGGDPCWPGPNPSPPAGAQASIPPAPDPTYEGHLIAMSFDGRPVSERLIAWQIDGLRRQVQIESGSGWPRRQLAGLSELDLDRAAVARLALTDLLLCEGLRDGIKVDPAGARVAAEVQVREAYQPAPSPPSGSAVAATPCSSSPLPSPFHGSVSMCGIEGHPPATPMPAPTSPLGGLSPEEYYLSPWYIDSIERQQVRDDEQRRITAGRPGPLADAVTPWIDRVIGRHRVAVSGLGSFSVADAYHRWEAAYEADFGAFGVTPRQ